jgi:hypothetical protein
MRNAIRDRVDETLELKEHEITPITLRKLGHSFRQFVNFLENQNVTRAEQIKVRHLLDYMRTWKCEDSTRQLEVRRLKQLLSKRNRDDLKKEIRAPRQTAEGIERRKARPYNDGEIASVRAVA